jgi:hypothetical protein
VVHLIQPEVHGVTPVCTAAGQEEADSNGDVQDTFLAGTAGVKEGPLALYRKQREEGLYRKVSAFIDSAQQLATADPLCHRQHIVHAMLMHMW